MRRFKNNDIKKLIINIGKCQTSFSSYYISLYFVLFIILKLYVYNYSSYPRKKPTFNHCYNILREEVDGHRAINWLNEIPQEKWTLAWDGS